MHRDNIQQNGRKSRSNSRLFASTEPTTDKEDASTEATQASKPQASRSQKKPAQQKPTVSTSRDVDAFDDKASSTPKFNTSALTALPRREKGKSYSFRCTKTQSDALDPIVDAILEAADKNGPEITKGSIFRGMVMAGAAQFAEAIESEDSETLEALFEQYGGGYGG